MRQCSALALECCSEPDERAFRIVFWPDFKADHEPHLEGGGDAAERFGLGCVLPIFDARDGRVARGCPLGDFLLGQAEVATTEHDRAGNRSERRSSLVLSSKLRIVPEALFNVLLDGLPDRADPRFVFVRGVVHNAHFIRNGKLGLGVYGASFPAALGDDRLGAFIRTWKSAQRARAMLISRRGTAFVVFLKA